MSMVVYDRLANLDNSRIDATIKVRVTRVWPTVAPDTGMTRGFNLVLLDDDNYHVHAFAYTDVWNSIGANVISGAVYVLTDFAVRESTGNLKPVSSRFCIRLQAASRFQVCEDDNMIPLHKFEFIDLGDLFNQASRYNANENPEYATDIIGVVETFEECKTIGTRYGPRDIVRFRICDKSNRHRVAVWGELARIVQQEFSPRLDEPVIVIVTSVKLGTYMNSVQISTLPSSKVYFNLNDPSVTEMMHKLKQQGYVTTFGHDALSIPYASMVNYEKAFLKDLTNNPAENITKNFYCTITIKMVDENAGWYLNACSICHKELYLIDNVYHCVFCIRNIPVSEKRFRVRVIAVDTTMETEVFLMDRAARRLIGKTASGLLQSIAKEEKKGVPPELKLLNNKEATFSFGFFKPATESDFELHAIDIYNAANINDSPQPSLTESDFPADEYNAINLTEAFDDSSTSETPGSVNSVNKKKKVEK